MSKETKTKFFRIFKRNVILTDEEPEEPLLVDLSTEESSPKRITLRRYKAKIIDLEEGKGNEAN